MTPLTRRHFLFIKFTIILTITSFCTGLLSAINKAKATKAVSLTLRSPFLLFKIIIFNQEQQKQQTANALVAVHKRVVFDGKI